MIRPRNATDLLARLANAAVVELLLASGADVNAKNETGRTPVDYVTSRPAPLRAALLQVLHP